MPDGNVADHLVDDRVHKLLLGRKPVAGEALASQPTISLFENGVGTVHRSTSWRASWR